MFLFCDRLVEMTHHGVRYLGYCTRERGHDQTTPCTDI
jgi:hypothetical protein